MSKLSAKKFVEQRKTMVTEHKELIYQRTKLNKQIRAVQREMNGWDNVLTGSEVTK